MKLGWSVSLRKLALMLLAFCLILPQAAFAAETESVPTFQFRDMDNHWAKKHVSKMGLLQITSGGDTKGNYLPNNNITREQAVMMVINLLGLQEEAKANTIAVNLDGYGISAWAHDSVRYAVVKGLIDLREESGNIVRNTQTLRSEWGTVNASREWIAKLVVKGIGKGAEAAERDGEYTGFDDDAAISDGFSGYVSVAKSLGIITGSNNRFNPTANITRAEMAVILGQALQHLPAQNRHVVQGTLDSVSPASITLRTSAGLVTYPLGLNAVFYTHNSNNAILPSSLTRGDSIFLIQYNDTAYYVEKTANTVNYETIVGEFVSIYTDPSQIAVRVNGELRLYPFTPGVTSFLSESGKGINMSDLAPDSVIELSRQTGTTVITSVVEKRKVEQKTVEATVEKIFADSRIIEYKETATGNNSLLEIPADVTIKSGSRTIGISDLYVGDKISISFKDGKIVGFDVTESVVTTIEGKVRRVSTADRMILLEGTDTPVIGYFTEPNVTVSITGLTSSKLADVQTGDEVLLELNANKRIRKVIVLNRTIDARMGVEFITFVEDSNTLVFQDADKKVDTKDLSANTAIRHQFNELKPDQINQYFKKGDKIDLVLTGDRIIRMAYSKSYTGVVKDISTRTNTVTLDAEDFGEVSFEYIANPFVLMFGKSGASFADIRVGSKVKVELDAAQNRVQYFSVIQNLLFKVKDKQSYKLVVTDSAGQSFDVSSPASATITHYDKLVASYNDVQNGGYVYISFTGTQATDIHIPRAAIGTVTSVDLAQNAFTFREYGKEARVVSDNRHVELGGKTYSNVSALKAGDRIQLVEGEDGVRLVTPLVKQQRKVFRYVAASKTLQFTTTNLQEQSAFTLTDEVYLHQNGTPISPASLAKDDVLDVYFHDGKLVEIEKR